MKTYKTEDFNIESGKHVTYIRTRYEYEDGDKPQIGSEWIINQFIVANTTGHKITLWHGVRNQYSDDNRYYIENRHEWYTIIVDGRVMVSGRSHEVAFYFLKGFNLNK